LQLPKKLAGVRRQRLDVTALPLGIEGIESERRLSGAADAREDNQLIARQVEFDVLQVVFAGAANDDVGGFDREVNGCALLLIYRAVNRSARHGRKVSLGKPLRF
jgi:hypothetical protein